MNIASHLKWVQASLLGMDREHMDQAMHFFHDMQNEGYVIKTAMRG